MNKADDQGDRMKYKIIFIICLCFITLAYHPNILAQSISNELFEESIKRFLIPENHPIKPQLDRLFSQRVTSSQQSMQDAGFISLDIWKWDKAYVVKHPLLKGYLIKVNLDNHYWMDDNFLIHRLIGAEAIRSAIETYGLQKYFKVPKKWLYRLPNPSAIPGVTSKNFILVVEDMNIVNQSINKQKFSECQDETKLLSLFILINTLGLSDSIYLKNIPFSKDGRIAFVDTERHSIWPVSLKKLLKNLHPTMRKKLEIYTH